jgi:hypothetical protein
MMVIIITEEFYLLGYNVVQSVERQPTYQRNMLHPSSGLKSSACYLLHTGFLLGLFFDPEDGSDVFFRNVGCLSTDYTALYPRRQNST